MIIGRNAYWDISFEQHCNDDIISDYFFLVCKAGRYRNVNTQTCDECPKGRYKENIGNDQCNLCGAFETTVNTGSMSANDCGEHLLLD